MKETLTHAITTPLNELTKRRYPHQLDYINQHRSKDRYAIIVFDALRYDYAAEILPQYFHGTLEPTYSAAHDTFQYGQRVWGDQIYEDVRYISGAVPLNSERAEFDNDHFNRLYGDFRPSSHLPQLVDAWRTGWDTSLGTTRPEAVTQTAHDHLDDDKLVVHYFQPHAPYIGRHSILGHTDTRDARPSKGEPVDKPLWDRVKDGAIPAHQLRTAYRANVHRGVQAALPLIRELVADRPVAIIADHGELLCDYGRRDMISHPRISFPQIRTVPWMAVDGIREFPDGQTQEVEAESVAERLEVLGYR